MAKKKQKKSTKKNSNEKLKWLAISFLTIFIIVVGIFISYKTNPSQPSSPNKPRVNTTPTPTPEIIQLGQKTYTNSSFSLKYPQNFTLRPGDSATYLVDMPHHALFSIGGSVPTHFAFTLGLYKNTGNLSARQFIEQYYNKGNRDALGKPIDPELKDMMFEEKNINDINMTFISGLSTVRGSVGPAVWFTHGTDGYFAICDNRMITNEEAVSNLEKVFSTFKFTN